VQPVLFDAVVERHVTAARPLAAKPPAHLVDSDLIPILNRQFISCGQGSDAATEDCNLFSHNEALHCKREQWKWVVSLLPFGRCKNWVNSSRTIGAGLRR